MQAPERIDNGGKRANSGRGACGQQAEIRRNGNRSRGAQENGRGRGLDQRRIVALLSLRPVLFRGRSRRRDARGPVARKPLKLPFLGVELPLKAFFFLAPILFLINHAYMLVNLVILAAKIGAFQEELVKQFPDACGGAAATREGLRRQLPSNILVLFLAGPADLRNGVLGMLLKA